MEFTSHPIACAKCSFVYPGHFPACPKCSLEPPSQYHTCLNCHVGFKRYTVCPSCKCADYHGSGSYSATSERGHYFYCCETCGQKTDYLSTPVHTKEVCPNCGCEAITHSRDRARIHLTASEIEDQCLCYDDLILSGRYAQIADALLDLLVRNGDKISITSIRSFETDVWPKVCERYFEIPHFSFPCRVRELVKVSDRNSIFAVNFFQLIVNALLLGPSNRALPYPHELLKPFYESLVDEAKKAMDELRTSREPAYSHWIAERRKQDFHEQLTSLSDEKRARINSVESNSEIPESLKPRMIEKIENAFKRRYLDLADQDFET